MSDAEVALGLLKLLLDTCQDARTAARKKEQLFEFYRECLAEVQKAGRA